MAATGSKEEPKRASERTFGQRYLKALGLYDLVKGEDGYDPKGNDLITKVAFKGHLDLVKAANQQVADLLPTYDGAQDKRVDLYYGPEGLISRAATVREVLGGLKNGKQRTAYGTVQRLVQEMRAYQKPKKEEATGVDPEPGRSTAQTSFGSLLQKGREVLGVMKDPGTAYVTGNALVTVVAFTKLLKELEDQDTVVTGALKPLNEAKRDRQKLFDGEEGLPARVTAMKSYVAGEMAGGKKGGLYKELVKVRYQ